MVFLENFQSRVKIAHSQIMPQADNIVWTMDIAIDPNFVLNRRVALARAQNEYLLFLYYVEHFFGND